IGWRETEYPAAKRFSGFRDGLHEAGLDLTDAVYFDKAHEIEIGKFGLQELLAKHPDIDAVYFVDDLAAVGGLMHCIEAGIDVPGSLALGGFGGLKIGQLTPRKITTVRLRRFETGKVSAKAVIDRLNGKNPRRIRDLGFKLIAGETA
ncbi:MAG: substrate-binding domain-containing protein, partial [Alphaproteobacteria bacterium]|nr:substrate-binding domain-containing protein [Alphaproteobacteria bacterium]